MHGASRMREPSLHPAAWEKFAWARHTPLRSIVCTFAIVATTSCKDVHDISEDESVPEGEAPARWSIGAELDDDVSGDVRPDALALIEARQRGEEPEVLAAAWQPPSTIRVWRRGLDGSTASCSGRVDVIAFETYVKGVLPHEWIRSWHTE